METQYQLNIVDPNPTYDRNIQKAIQSVSLRQLRDPKITRSKSPQDSVEADKLNYTGDNGFPIAINMLLYDNSEIDNVLKLLDYDLPETESYPVKYNLLWYESYYQFDDIISKDQKQYLSKFNVDQLEPFLWANYQGARGKAEYLFALSKITELPISMTRILNDIYSPTNQGILHKVKPEVIFWMIMYYCSKYDKNSDTWDISSFFELYDFRLPPYLFIATIKVDLPYILFLMVDPPDDNNSNYYNTFIEMCRKIRIVPPVDKSSFSYEWLAQTLSIIKYSGEEGRRLLSLN